MWQAMAMLAWLVGTVFGGLWASSLEHEDGASARRHGIGMSYFYFVSAVLMGFAPVPAGWWTALVAIVIAAFFSAVVVVGRRRVRR